MPPRCGFNDLILMAPPVIWGPGMGLGQALTIGYSASLCWFPEQEKIFRSLLDQYVNDKKNNGGTPQTKVVRERMEWLRNHTRRVETAEETHNYHDETTELFVKLSELPKNKIKFFDLLSAHFSKASIAAIVALKDLEKDRTRHNWRSKNMHIYFDYIPDYVASMGKKECYNGVLVTEAWFNLMLRPYLFQKLHHLRSGKGRTYRRSTMAVGFLFIVLRRCAEIICNETA